jgi:hypothetical protein
VYKPVGETRNAYDILVGKSERKIVLLALLGKLRRSWDVNIKAR